MDTQQALTDNINKTQLARLFLLESSSQFDVSDEERY
jgi:hypothetical protein